MIFTTLIKNDNIFNEADSKNKLTIDRTQLLKNVAKLIKTELGSSLEEHTTFRTDKDYGKNDFINGKCEFITVAHIKKSAEPYIGNQYENAKAILDQLNRMCNKINSKIPSDCKVIPKYKGDPNGDQWDGWDINLAVPQNKNEFLSESYIGGGNVIFTECAENNEIIFNESTELGFAALAAGAFFAAVFGKDIINDMKKSIADKKEYKFVISNKVLKAPPEYGYSNEEAALGNFVYYDMNMRSAIDGKMMVEKSQVSKLNTEVYLYKFNKSKIDLVKQCDLKQMCSHIGISIEEYDKNAIKDREKVLNNAIKFTKATLDPVLKKYATYKIYDDDKNKFLNGTDDVIFIGHINAWDIIPNARSEVDKVGELFNTLTDNCKEIQKKIPDEYTISCDGDWDDWLIELRAPAIKNESTRLVAFSGNTGGSYIHDSLYESYIQSKIDSENRLAFALKESMAISESDYSNIRAINEAKLGDKIKTKWQKFVAFIKNMFAKFMESMTNILYNEKEYLEKYKDIILRKKPKEDMEYSYTGDYKEGINRITNVEVELFDYHKFKDKLEADGDGALAKEFLPSFTYTDGETLAEQCKGYFLVLDAGTKEGKFSDLNMQELYNFCYNFNKIKNIVNRDLDRIDASTRNIEKMIKDNLASANNPTTSTITKPETNTNNDEGHSDKAQAVINAYNNSAILVENEAGDKKDSENTNLNITTDVSKAVKSTSERNEDKEKEAAENAKSDASDKKEEDIASAADKWIRVCQTIVAAKLTACQQIAKDYMDIIRAHVRSYVGTPKKSKEGNTSPRKAPEYKNKESKAADDKNKEADDNLKKAMNASSGG